MKLCPCGSGQRRRDLIDAAGIFCTFVCNDCEDGKRKKFDPKIFDTRSSYATHGTSDALEADDYRNEGD